MEDGLDALRNRFCTVQLQEVPLLKLEQKKFDPKNDIPENFLVTLQTKAQRAYLAPNLLEVALLRLFGLQQSRHDLTVKRRNEQNDYRQLKITKMNKSKGSLSARQQFERCVAKTTTLEIVSMK